MAAPEFVPVDESKPVQGYESPPRRPESWTADRPAEVVSEGQPRGDRFGAPGRPELELSGDPASGTIFYHRTLYARGEDQSLRFANGDHSYVIFNGWSVLKSNEALACIRSADPCQRSLA